MQRPKKAVNASKNAIPNPTKNFIIQTNATAEKSVLKKKESSKSKTTSTSALQSIASNKTNLNKEGDLTRKKEDLHPTTKSSATIKNPSELNSKAAASVDDTKIYESATAMSKDSVVVDSISKKELDPILFKEKKKEEEDEEIEEKDEVSKRWQLSLQGGPNMYTNLSSSFVFDDRITNRQIQAGISYSYGALINLPFTDKLSFRFGYRNINTRLLAKGAIHLLDSITPPYQSIVNSTAIIRNGTPLGGNLNETLSPPLEFDIEQNANYHVYPFEMMYRLKDGKLKLNAILGASVMTLGKTSVSVLNQNGKFTLGRAAYLKNLSIAPSIGLGIKYELIEGIILDLEPSLQYPINSFETDFKNAHPLLFSIQLGTTIKL